MNTEFKSMVQLMRSKDPTNRDLGFELAKGVFPEFWEWFEGKVTEILIKAEENKWVKYLFQYEESPDKEAPKRHSLGSLAFNRFKFWKDIWAYIIRNGYTDFCYLSICGCGAGFYCLKNCPCLE